MSVDPRLTPETASLPGPDGTERPLGVIKDSRGNRVHFVERELVVSTDDDAALAALVAKWRGQVLNSFDPAMYHLEGLPKMHLIRIDPTVADPATLSANLRALDPKSRGELRVSSESGRGLFAAAAAEAASGATVGINWVSTGATFRDRTTAEAPTGVSGNGYSTNAFQWPYTASGNALNVGVGEAWRALDLAGRLGGPRIGLGVIDGGFAGDHRDYPPGDRTFISAIPFVFDARDFPNTMGCGGTPCPWHGLGAALTAMAVPDNGYGAAGPAGPVARPIFTITLGDMFTTIAAIPMTRDAGARIITMSFGAPIPAALSFSVLPLDATTNAVRSQGVLLFGSAGNANTDVDEEDCAGVCWEDTWNYLCENTGVTCVGATNLFDTQRVWYSNWGGAGGDTVDIWAPGTEFVGMDRDPSGFLRPPAAGSNMADIFTGTSSATPFVAGVAALVWTANPGLTANQVEQILLETATPGGSPEVRRFVHAYDAVIRALGGRPNEPPAIAITGPSPNAIVQLNRGVTFVSRPADPEDGVPCCNVAWSSTTGERLAGGPSITHTFTSTGTRTITATATDSGRQTASAAVSISVVNSPPAVVIDNPPFPVYPSQVFEVVGRGSDVNEPGGAIACAAFQWSASDPAVTVRPNGCRVALTAPSARAFDVTLRVADSQGLPAQASRRVVVSPAPVNFPPAVRVTTPPAGALLRHDQVTRLEATASDPEGNNPVTLVWTVTSYDQNGNVFRGPIEIGRGTVVDFRPQSFHLNDYRVCFGIPGQTAEITVRATDSLGNTRSATVAVEIICVPE